MKIGFDSWSIFRDNLYTFKHVIMRNLNNCFYASLICEKKSYKIQHSYFTLYYMKYNEYVEFSELMLTELHWWYCAYGSILCRGKR